MLLARGDWVGLAGFKHGISGVGVGLGSTSGQLWPLRGGFRQG